MFQRIINLVLHRPKTFTSMLLWSLTLTDSIHVHYYFDEIILGALCENQIYLSMSISTKENLGHYFLFQ